MLKRLLIFLFILCTVAVKAQNLVPNPSFELADSCSPGQNIFVSTGWKSYSGTPDYYNGCTDSISSGGFSVPNNFWGVIPAADGLAYAGFYSYESDTSNANVREYIGRGLTSPLVIGTKYFVSFKVRPMNTAGGDCANSGIGILFSTIPFNECPFPDSQAVIRPTPNIATIYGSTIISDTTNWTTISGYFTADSAYQYFQIGNLFSDSLTDTLIYSSSVHLWQHIAYYLLDDIVVMDSLLTSVAINSSLKGFNVYPNPFNTSTTVRINPEFKQGILKISDLMGNELEQINITNEETIIDRTNLPNGIYILKIYIDNKAYTQKLIIN
ncbi:MAG: hypothetical protein JWO44_1435 [Bacteroidetes bacterium]|nr:hypothetical protein [Bacteroidota bacterium]